MILILNIDLYMLHQLAKKLWWFTLSVFRFKEKAKKFVVLHQLLANKTHRFLSVTWKNIQFFVYIFLLYTHLMLVANKLFFYLLLETALVCFDCRGIGHPRFCEIVKECTGNQVGS